MKLSTKKARKLLLEGAETGDIGRLRTALAAGADNKEKALLKACENDEGEALSYLAEQGADVDYGDEYNDTPLYYASFRGYTDIVGRLLNAGADINRRGEDGDTPLYMASWRRNEDIVACLLEAGADTSLQKHYRGTPLHIAARNGHTRIVRLLLGANADISLQDDYGDTPLYDASSSGHIEIVNLLLDAGADVLATNRGCTPLEAARDRCHTEVIKRLEQAERDAEQKQAQDAKRILGAQSRGQGGY